MYRYTHENGKYVIYSPTQVPVFETKDWKMLTDVLFLLNGVEQKRNTSK